MPRIIILNIQYLILNSPFKVFILYFDAIVSKFSFYTTYKIVLDKIATTKNRKDQLCRIKITLF